MANNNRSRSPIVNEYRHARRRNADIHTEWALSTVCPSCRRDLSGHFYLFIAKYCGHLACERCFFTRSLYQPQCDRCEDHDSVWIRPLVTRRYYNINRTNFIADSPLLNYYSGEPSQS